MKEILTLSKRIAAFNKLGSLFLKPEENFSALMGTASYFNPWFTQEQTERAVKSIGVMLNEHDLSVWLEKWGAGIQNSKLKTVGLVLAGNIPMVGFHDILCVLISGNQALIKLSSQDNKLIPFILNKLTEIEPGFSNRIHFTERLENFDAVIATGSNNTSRYFDYYFGKVPHIIRKNRNSIAVLTGTEDASQLSALGNDIFAYFGLGCRNVSKLFVPQGYKFDHFFRSVESFQDIINHNKYCNNYEYNKSIFLVNRDDHFDNGFLLLKQDERIASPLAVVYYEEYNSMPEIEEKINVLNEQIQLVVSSADLKINAQLVVPGESQNPKLWDYADRIDTIAFLSAL